MARTVILVQLFALAGALATAGCTSSGNDHHDCTWSVEFRGVDYRELEIQAVNQHLTVQDVNSRPGLGARIGTGQVPVCPGTGTEYGPTAPVTLYAVQGLPTSVAVATRKGQVADQIAIAKDVRVPAVLLRSPQPTD